MSATDWVETPATPAIWRRDALALARRTAATHWASISSLSRVSRSTTRSAATSALFKTSISSRSRSDFAALITPPRLLPDEPGAIALVVLPAGELADPRDHLRP